MRHFIKLSLGLTMNNIIVFADVETTGFNPEVDVIVEVAMVIQNRDGGLITFQRYIRWDSYPENFKEAFEVSGITLELLDKKGFPPRKVYEDLLAWLKFNTGYFLNNKNVFIAGHNISFDVRFLEVFMKKMWKKETDELLHKIFLSPKIDTMTLYAEAMMRGAVPDTSSFKLKTLCNKLDIKVDNFHSALDDAIASMRVRNKVWKLIEPDTRQVVMFDLNQIDHL